MSYVDVTTSSRHELVRIASSAIGGVSSPVNSVLPAITGTPTEGQVLTCSTGTWSNSPTGYSRQWKRGAVNIGTNSPTYTLVTADLGSVISCVVTATNAGGSASATSNVVGPVEAALAAPINTVLPAISGTLNEGQTLTTTNGTWTGNPTPTYARQWKRGGVNISGATGLTYVLVSADAGTMITVTVTATNSQGTVPVTSAAVGPVVGAPVAVLTSVSAVDFSDIFVWLQATTDTGAGSLYAVVCPSAAAAPSAAQIKLGQDGTGAAATSSGSQAISSTGSKQLLLRGLTAVTAYKLYVTHETSGGFSLVSNASFTTDTLVLAVLANGTNTGISGAMTGSAALTAVADPHGGTNALHWVDVNDSVTGAITLTLNAITFFNGPLKNHITVKNISGAQWTRLTYAQMTVNPYINFNSTTAAIGVETFTGTPVAYDLGGGWVMFSGIADITGADVVGNASLAMAMVDNNTATNVRNGGNVKDIYNWRITRV